MINIQIVYKNINDLKKYKKNPRKNAKAIDAVSESIKCFGFKNPIIIDKNDEIIAGHTRYDAAKKLGLSEVPTIIADDLTNEEVNAFRLIDNKTSELSEWDFELLESEMKNIKDVNFEDFGFLIGEKQLKDNCCIEDVIYTEKTSIPQYDVKGIEYDISELIDRKKFNEIVEKINASSLNVAQKNFLLDSATRHLKFNFSAIAEYYLLQSKEMQEFMEDQALVIIDYDDAIKNGYVELQSKIKNIVGE